MKEYLEEIFNIEEDDGFTFTPSEKDFDITEVKAFAYNNRGELVPGTSLGKKWHVVIYRETDEGITHQDHFVPILGDPIQYGASLIETGWFGLISKKTTTSDSVVIPIFDTICESANSTKLALAEE